MVFVRSFRKCTRVSQKDDLAKQRTTTLLLLGRIHCNVGVLEQLLR